MTDEDLYFGIFIMVVAAIIIIYIQHGILDTLVLEDRWIEFSDSCNQCLKNNSIPETFDTVGMNDTAWKLSRVYCKNECPDFVENYI